MPKAVLTEVHSLDGAMLRELLAAGCAALEVHAASINALNVFPVPDGDTGTNMLLTIRDALKELPGTESPAASEIAMAASKGALMGARGNSGVIFSQFFRGIAAGVHGADHIGGDRLAQALQEAPAFAYKAVGDPKEGTILTVIREVAEATRPMTSAGSSVSSVLRTATMTAKDSVARTPLRLPVLRENGVVDAGGQGLWAFLDGMTSRLTGETPATPPEVVSPIPAMRSSGHGAEDDAFGFCTEFFIRDPARDVEALRNTFEGMAKSVAVVASDGLVKVHLHTLDPDEVLEIARSAGAVDHLKVEDMDRQHEEFAETPESTGRTAVVAVVAGRGMETVFKSLGAAALVPGGQTMNPSARRILEAIVEVPSDEVILLPNNDNVVLAANQAAEMAHGKRVTVVPTADLAQGVAAMMSFNYEKAAGQNASAMETAVRGVKTGGVTRAVRQAHLDGIQVAKGQAIAMSGGSLVAAGQEFATVLERLIERLGIEDDSAVTLYYGAPVSEDEAESERDRLQERFPDAEVVRVYGGQPHHHYLVAVE